ncbi:zinc finger protein 665-like [Cydia amplana]|uniref:zinc finger protein 665-like n=1 Tax=Cydia amplana TaxID=1869771 RepID=UPI002FE54E19
MSRFLLLNFKDFGLNQDITQTIQSQTLACICCLDSNVPLINLSTCKHEIYLQNFYKTVAEPTKKVVCLECHNVLKMIETFRQQVVNSFQRLTEEVTSKPPQNYNKLNKNKYKLTEKKTVNIYLPPAKYTAEKWQPQPQINKIVKKEVESAEPALPVVKIKAEPVESEREKVEIEIVPVKKREEAKGTKLLEKAKKNPAVRTVTLTKEELVLERLKLAQSPAYLKLPYRCESCVVGFNYEENIQDHMKRKHGPKVGSVTCDVCLAVLHPPGSLAAHMFRHLTRYACVKCDARYPSYDDTLHHYKKQHGGDCLRCAECHYTTDSEVRRALPELRRHAAPLQEATRRRLSALRRVPLHHRVSCFTVVKCDARYPSYDDTLHHYKKQHGGDLVKCDARYPSYDDTLHHYKKQHGGDCLRCAECHYTTESPQKFRKHKRLHHKRFTCADCGVVLATRPSLTRHMAVLHNKRLYRCVHCSLTLTDGGAFASHMRAHGAAAARAACAPCGVQFKAWHAYNAHHLYSTAHRNTNKITCTHCGMKFATATHLRMHVQFSDHPKQTFHCPDCPKEFAVEAEMRQHRNIHKKQRLRSTDRICDYCGRVYTSREHLIRHIQTHLLKRQKAKERAKSTARPHKPK